MHQALRDAAAAPPVPQSTDRRSVRTRRALRQALADEIDATGDLTRVTVTAVTERAGVTRRTFYSHFRDIPDLVNQIEAETLAELCAHVVRISECHLGQLQESLSRQEPAPGSIELLTCVRERGDYLRPLLGDGGDPAFAERLKRMVRENDLAVLLSLHELDLAQRISDTVICVAGDRIDRIGTPEEIFTSDYIAQLYHLERGKYDECFSTLEFVP